MRLLIVTQAVDLDDPVLGFFHRWITEFAKHCERVHVICLREGRHELPKNVFVHSLGKENGRSRIKYIINFYRFTWKYHREYDAVFVHMNQEYILLGAPVWKLLSKRTGMWRNHYAGNFLTNIAVAWSDMVFCTSEDSYTAKFGKAMLMPIGIDTESFSPPQEPPKPNSVLFLGRLDPSKRVDLFIRALEHLYDEGIVFSATIVGDPSDPKSKYAHDVRNLAGPLALTGILVMRSGIPNTQARDMFRSHAIYCNLSPQGMFDKTIGEAMVSGCVVACSNEAVRNVIPKTFVSNLDPEGVAATLRAALEFNVPERIVAVATERSYIEHEHSLRLLVERLLGAYGIAEGHY